MNVDRDGGARHRRLDAGPHPQGRGAARPADPGPPFVDSPYVTTVFISALLFGLFGAVYDLMIGYAGPANFGYAGFIAAGATAPRSPFHYGISPWLGLLIGGLRCLVVC